MRVVGGSLRGRPLQAPSGPAVRPTSDRVKEALFNILAHGSFGLGWSGLDRAHVLDAFAGSGALGIEALSRGAAHVDFIETDAAARQHLTRNLTNLNLTGLANVHAADAARPPPNRGRPVNLLLLDPPYGSVLGVRALAALAHNGWLAAAALAVLEGSGVPAPQIAGFEILQTRRYGRTSLVFCRWSGGEGPDRHPALQNNRQD